MSDSYEAQAADFTEAEYRSILRLANERYTFLTFSERNATQPGVLWRHDIDVSPHRARALARLEAEEGIRATYFVLLHSDMYNALEPAILDIFREIASLGHDLGLHFDPSVHAGSGNLEDLLWFERGILEKVLGVPIRSFSWHSPSRGTWIDDESATEIAGMVNTYSAEIRNAFSYISDSHGIWRFRRLRDVIETGEEQRLHVLTHAEWWVPSPISPRARIERAVRGRSDRVLADYDEGLRAMGRPNVR